MPVEAAAFGGRKIEAFKSAFFDTEKVLKAVDASIRRQLNWLGGYVRKVARNSLKAKAGVSAPGQPPFLHLTYRQTHVTKKKQRVKLAAPRTRYSFKDSVLYAYEANAKSVIVGPFLFNGARTSPTVPELLEHGGTVERKRAGGVVFTAHYRPRPFMQPALDVAIPKFMDRLEDDVK